MMILISSIVNSCSSDIECVANIRCVPISKHDPLTKFSQLPSQSLLKNSQHAAKYCSTIEQYMAQYVTTSYINSGIDNDHRCVSLFIVPQINPSPTIMIVDQLWSILDFYFTHCGNYAV